MSTRTHTYLDPKQNDRPGYLRCGYKCSVCQHKGVDWGLVATQDDERTYHCFLNLRDHHTKFRFRHNYCTCFCKVQLWNTCAKLFGVLERGEEKEEEEEEEEKKEEISRT